MERVQFQQEQMLAELKDLVQKGLFTQKEIRQIMQKRTTFETALVRRIPRKGDFLRYAAYEMGLEALRRKRVERLKQGPQPPSVSDYALVRRQFHIFERALKKFKSDVGLWIQYIQVAKKEGARTLVGRISARALQLHPNVPALYILAASHELEHLSPSAARALLQRGIRLNADSVEMWREYVKMELGFVESLRRRWEVLGIQVREGKGKEKASDSEEGQRDEEMGDGETNKMQVDAEEEGEEGEAARREIMEGAIVKSVIASAVKALPRIELFTSLHELLSTYPCPPSLRTALLDYLFPLLQSTLPSDPAAIRLSATRHLTPELAGEDLIDALKVANEQLSGAIRDRGKEGESVAVLYAEFVEEWCNKDIDDSLKGYLITSLQLLAQHKSTPKSPSLLAANITLLVSHLDRLRAHLPSSTSMPEKILRLARKYTSKDQAHTSAKVWLARLEAEKRFASSEEVMQAWDEARGAVQGEGIMDVWVWGLERMEGSEGEKVLLLERLLTDCKRARDAAAWGSLHETLLMRYTESTHAALLVAQGLETDSSETCAGVPEMPETNVEPAHGDDEWVSDKPSPEKTQSFATSHRFSTKSSAEVVAVVDARAARVRHISTAYLPTARVWKEVFAQEVAAADAMAMRCGPDHAGMGRVLETVYEFWRRKDGVRATVEWAKWQLGHGRAKAATDVVMRSRSWLPTADAREVERQWQRQLHDAAAESDA